MKELIIKHIWESSDLEGEIQKERVLTKTRNDLKLPTTSKKRPETTWKDLQRAKNDMERPETTYSKQETTWNNLNQPITSKKQPETTYNEQETIWNNLQRARNDLIVLHWKGHYFSSSWFEIIKHGKIVDLELNFKNFY